MPIMRLPQSSRLGQELVARFGSVQREVSPPKAICAVITFSKPNGNGYSRRQVLSWADELEAERCFRKCRAGCRVLVRANGRILSRGGDRKYERAWIQRSKLHVLSSRTEEGRWQRPLLAAASGMGHNWSDHPPTRPFPHQRRL